MAAPSIEDLRQQGRAELLVRRPDLRNLPGDVTDFLLSGAAAAGDFATLFAAQRFSATFLDTASGDELTTLAEDHFGVVRRVAVQAVGDVTFTSTAGPVTGTIPTGTRVATVPDASGNFQTFVTFFDAVFSANSIVTAPCQAVVGGTAGNVALNTVTRILDTLFTPFTAFNALPFDGGTEAESDESLRFRAKRVLQDAQRATPQALVTGAFQVPGVGSASVREDGVQVTVFVTDVEGNSTPALTNAVNRELENWRAAGIQVAVQGGLLVTQDVTVSLTVRTGVAVSPLADAVRSSITAALGRLEIGETLFRTLIQQAVRDVDRDNIVDVTVTVPGADIQPAANEVIRAGTVLVS